MWLTWFWWRQCLLIAVASVSIHLNAFLVKTDYPKCSSWRAKKCLLVLPMWTLLQVFHVNLYSSIELRHLGIWSLNRKALNILTVTLTLSWRRPLSYRNQSIDLSKSMDWFLYDNGHRHERVKSKFKLMSLWQVRNISISCLFTWRSIFPKNSKDTAIFFLVELSSTFFLLINTLSKNFLMHFSMKNNGKEFFCHTDFKNKITWWKLA